MTYYTNNRKRSSPIAKPAYFFQAKKHTISVSLYNTIIPNERRFDNVGNKI